VTASEQSESAVRLEVSVGNEALEPGRTEVLLDERGRVHVLSKLEGADARRAEAKLDPERASQMIQTAGGSLAAAREGKRYGLPDEPRYHFVIGEGDRRQSFDVWRSDLPQHPELNRIVQELQQVVDKQVEGEIIL
jgi:hypothetical protein